MSKTELYDFNEYQVRNGLRKHWRWLKNLPDHRDIADFIIAHGRRPIGTVYDPRFTWDEWQVEEL